MNQTPPPSDPQETETSWVMKLALGMSIVALLLGLISLGTRIAGH